jgi:DNA-binding protein HU-beta
MQTITKEKIALFLKERIGLSGALCEELVTEIFAQIIAISSNEKLMLKNFGSFSVSSKVARPAFNLSTKQAIKLPARKVLRFIPAKSLKKSINSHEKILLNQRHSFYF